MPGILFSLQRLHKTSRALSLDVVIGVLAMAIFAAKILKEETSASWLLILGLATWSFYTFDHLTDALKTKGDTDNHRHRFHFVNFRILLVISTISAILAVTLSLWYFNTEVIHKGILLGLFIFAYFVVVYRHHGRNPLLQKEFFIALVYVAGIWLVPMTKYGGMPSNEVILVMAYLFILAWAEGVMAAFYDYENDKKDGHSSFAIVFGKKKPISFLRYHLYLLLQA